MKLINGTDTSLEYPDTLYADGNEDILAIMLGLLELQSGWFYSHSISTSPADSEDKIKKVYDTLEWMGFSTNDHEWDVDADGDVSGYIIGGFCDYAQYKVCQNNILLLMASYPDVFPDKDYYKYASLIRLTDEKEEFLFGISQGG